MLSSIEPPTIELSDCESKKTTIQQLYSKIDLRKPSLLFIPSSFFDSEAFGDKFFYRGENFLFYTLDII